MSEIKRVVTPMANTMMVLEQGEDIIRSPSSLSRRPLKKSTSEGLISLSAEPGNVKFEVETQKMPVLGAQRCSSAGRIERKLQLFKKKEDMEVQRRNSTNGMLYSSHPDNPLINKVNAMTIDAVTSATKLKDDKQQSSEAESDSDESESNKEKGETSALDDGKVTAPLELKADFIQCVMNGEYTKAKQICQKILLLEPDNATCNEFHSVIKMKIEQDNREDSDEDEDESDDDSDDDDDSEDDDDDEDNDEDNNDSNTSTGSSSSSEESDTESDDEFTVNPGFNLIMGGLPIKPQSK